MEKKVFNRITELLLRPFRNHFLFLIAFYILATSPCILHQFFIIKANINAITLAIHCFVLSYIITFFVGLITQAKIRTIVQSIILILAGTDFALNYYCIFELGYLFDADFAKILLDTNFNEANEFVSSMIPKHVVWGVITIYFVFLSLWFLSTKRNLNLGKRTSQLAMGVLCLCVAENAYSWQIWKDGPIHRITELPEFEAPQNFQDYFTHPKISINVEKPTNVVVIIGESFTRCHSSLYSYEKNTNPNLKKLKENSQLFTFDSVDAPAPSTAQSIKYMMSTYNKSDTLSNKKWYEYTSIIELMQVCGYNCYWFSNQARGSKHNGISRALANICKKQWFLQKEGSEKIDEQVNKMFDQVLVDSSCLFVNRLKPEEYNFIIYHMMGSHFHYKMRYPKEFDIFSENDYSTEPQDHRTILATYDNSILYNDYIVWNLIDLFKKTESVIIYVPDHGQVMYRDPRSPDYYFHGVENDSISNSYGIDIPFMIYTSPLFQEKHPDITRRIIYRQENPKHWNSDDLPYFIMDLIGVKEINGEDISSKSILN